MNFSKDLRQSKLMKALRQTKNPVYPEWLIAKLTRQEIGPAPRHRNTPRYYPIFFHLVGTGYREILRELIDAGKVTNTLDWRIRLVQKTQ